MSGGLLVILQPALSRCLLIQLRPVQGHRQMKTPITHSQLVADSEMAVLA